MSQPCRHCDESIEPGPTGGWMDADGFTRCQKNLPHEPFAALRDPAPLAAEDRDPPDKALDRIFRTARRLWVRLPEEGADAEDVHIASIITEIESQVRSALKAETPEPTALDVDALAAAWANVMDGRRIARGLGEARIGRDTTTTDDWHVIAAEYIRLATLRSTTPPEPEDGGT